MSMPLLATPPPQAEAQEPEQLPLWSDWGPDMGKLKRAAARLVVFAKAKATRRAYDADWRDFAAWCKAAGKQELPADPETVRLYLAELLEERKVSTVERRLAAIGSVHRAAGHLRPIDERTRELMRGARRAKGGRPVQKRALEVADLARMSRAMPKDALGVRDRALLLLGFATALRRSELSALELGDVAFARQGLRVFVRKSKTDQAGEGREIGVFPGKRVYTDPVRAMRAWVYIRGREPGPLFTAVRSGGATLERLSGEAIGKRVKRAAERVGLDPADYGGHSLRAGMVTAALESGVPDAVVMARSGHRSHAAFLRYLRSASAFRVNPLAQAL